MFYNTAGDRAITKQLHFVLLSMSAGVFLCFCYCLSSGLAAERAHCELAEALLASVAGVS